jgi:hypothetical protein
MDPILRRHPRTPTYLGIHATYRHDDRATLVRGGVPIATVQLHGHPAATRASVAAWC